LYTREIKAAPDKLIVNGKPVFGTFGKHPYRLDIRGVKNPFGIMPVPTIITNLKIKSKIRFTFSMDDFEGFIIIFNLKIFGLVEVCLWNKKTNQKYNYRTITGPKTRFIPHNLEKASSSVLIRRRFLKISWDRPKNYFHVFFTMHGGRTVRPTISGSINMNFSDPSCCELTNVCPSPVMSRCSATYSLASTVDCKLSLNSRNKNEKPVIYQSTGTALFEMNRTYVKFHHTGEYVTACGEVDGKPLIFCISSTSQDAVNTDLYNSNVLFYNGSVTPLSPAVITHPFGVREKWIIQDTENMIDLTFTPRSDNITNANLLVLRTETHAIYGTFEGTLMTSCGEKISFKNLPGLSRKYLIRL